MINAYFFDSSTLVKRYITEVGSLWVQNITIPTANNPIFMARITWVELLSAFARLQRESKLTSTDLAKTIRNFRYDMQSQYQIIEIDPQLMEDAGQLVQRYTPYGRMIVCN